MNDAVLGEPRCRSSNGECKQTGPPLFRGWEEAAVWLEGRANECNVPTDVLHASLVGKSIGRRVAATAVRYGVIILR